MDPHSQAKLEEDLLAFWERERIFQRSVERDAPNGDFVFYEGPPTANAPPGIHHVESRTFKDVIPRYKTMRGFRVVRKAGWDTHGLPVELQTEKALGLTTKKDVEAYGIAAFNAKCRDSVWAFKEEWEKLTRRIGFWLDMDDPYVTYETPYIESVWWFLKQCHERKLLSRDDKIVPWCPRCETPLSSHEVALGYEDDTEDPSVFVRFMLTRESCARLGVSDDTAFLVWTTTPWTLPGNGALAVHPDGAYAVVAHDGGALIVAKPLVSSAIGDAARIERTIPASALLGLRYEPLYARIDTNTSPDAYRVLDAPFVSFDDGTGIVHIAPAYGEDDFMFKRRGIPVTHSVDEHGMMAEGLPGAGTFAKEADTAIRDDLRSRGLLERDETIRHTYPFCWRCKTPLLYYARPAWYIAMATLRREIQALNAAIDWRPAHITEGRMGEWLRELKDWGITRERYWGAPLPIWHCDTCERNEVLGSVAELLERAPKKNRFIIMRHGEAVSNVENIISTKIETSDRYPLTANGEARVRHAAEALKREGITKIVASPFHRMRQTATIVSEAVDIPVEYADELREYDLPEYDGQPTGTYNTQFRTRREKFEKKIGTNETWNELRERLLRYLKQLDDTHAGETFLVCTHGDNIWLLRWALSGMTYAGIDAIPYPDYDAPTSLPFSSSLVNDRGEFDVHRPYVDGVSWMCGVAGCAGTMERYPEVADVWLESGAMPFAQHHYPFEWSGREDDFPYPAGYISEAIDQTRGWFYTLLAVATVLGKDRPPYSACLVLGHLLDKEGKKMSKSRGNVVDPWAMIDRYGADVVRWYMLAVNQPWDPKLFDENDLKVMSRKPFGTLKNVRSFWELHGGHAAPAWASVHVLDAWLRARIASLHREVTRHLDAYEITEAARAISDAVDDCSTWWLRRSRERLKAGDVDARQTFSVALQSLAVLFAPFAPFTAEYMWRALGARGKTSDVEEEQSDGSAPDGKERASSVHLASWDDHAPPVNNGDAQLLEQMATIRRICSLGLEARDTAKVPVRQPLRAVRVAAATPLRVQSELLDLVKEELNVKAVLEEVGVGELQVTLDVEITAELKREGMVRELARKVNDLRKQRGLAPSDRIRATYATDDAELARAIEEHRETLERMTAAHGWIEGEPRMPLVIVNGDATITIDMEA